MPKTLYYIKDSRFKAEIIQRINQRSTGELTISSILHFNIVTILTIALAADGLSVFSSSLYLFFAYFLLTASTLIEVYLKPLNYSSTLAALIEALAIASALFINESSEKSASNIIAIISVCVVTFLTLPISIRSFGIFLLSKGVIISACLIYTVLLVDDLNRIIYLGFPLIITFFLIVVIAYWLYIRHVALLHQQFETNHFKNTIDEQNRSLKEARNRLEHEHGLRDKLIRHIGHDLRQPINTVNYSLFNIDKSTLHQDHKIQIDIAQKSIDTANYLIEDILQISSYRKHDIEANIESFVVQDLLDLLAREYSSIAQLNNIELSIIPCSLRIHSDIRLVSRIMRNFLSNAIRHSHAQKITIGVRRKTHGIHLQLIDNGVGIAADKQPFLFTEMPLEQASQDNINFGLGLSIANNLALACGAQASITTMEGRGTNCCLKLPHSFKTTNGCED